MHRSTSPHFAFRAPLIAAAGITFLAGCGGPTHTAGTKGMAVNELSVLSIPQLPTEAHLRIHTIQFDGQGEHYEVGKHRDFYLAPSSHTASFTLLATLPNVGGPMGWWVPKTMTLPGPMEIPLGTLAAEKTYELALPTEGFDKLMETGELAFVREKTK